MGRNDQEIRNVIARCIIDSELPREISLDNENVLKLVEYQKHHSLVFVDKLLFRVTPAKDNCLLEFQREYEHFLPKSEEPSDKWIKLPLQDIDEIVSLKESIVNIIQYELKRTHGEAFGCCSKYVQCSDSRRCIHEDFLFSLCCQYRLNLLEGKIFYGKNAEPLTSEDEELLEGKKIDYPAPATTSVTFKKAPKAKKMGHEAMSLFGGSVREEE
jgi:hypothetical protein